MDINHNRFYEAAVPRSGQEAGISGGAESPSWRHDFGSEPLSRGASSEGSTQGSSCMTSPMFDNGHYTFHSSSPLPGSPDLEDSQVAAASPLTLYGSYGRDTEQDMRTLAASRNVGSSVHRKFRRDYPVCCLHPGCTARPFKRRADLDRHYKHRHAPDSVKESFKCDYPRCSRRLDPFHRLDHFRDHLREYHKEDIEKRGGSCDDSSWYGDRQVSSSWWRCSKCLRRVHVDGSGYECPNCRTSCQARRKEARRQG